MASTNTMEGRFNTRELFEGGLRVLIVLLVIIVLLVTLDWLLQSDTYQVEQLAFEGKFEHVTEHQLEQVLLPVVEKNYLMLDLDDIRNRVESLPWVKRAWIRRNWPNGIHIRFVEETPVALWGDNSSVNANGRVIPAIEKNMISTLPRLNGPTGSSQMVLATYNRFRVIAQGMGARIAALKLTSRRTWQLTLARGTEIVIDQKDSEKKFERLARVFDQLGTSPKRLDLRYTNGFAVDWGNKSQSPQL